MIGPDRRRGERLTASQYLVYGVASLIGLAAFLYPIWRPVPAAAMPDAAHAADAPLVLGALVGLCFLALLMEAGSGLGQGALGARAVASLGVLVAVNSTLRFVEVAIPGPGGFTPIFLLILLTGYVYGARFGFLMGALTLVVSAVITGGVGPWLPYQMLAAGWAGLSAGWLPARPGLDRMGRRREVMMLAAFGVAWGLLYGMIMTLWFWPFVDGQAGLVGPAGQSALAVIGARLARFLVFYGVTSLWWDLFGAAGNALLILAAGGPILAALRRAGRWFRFAADEASAPEPVSVQVCDTGIEPGNTARTARTARSAWSNRTTRNTRPAQTTTLTRSRFGPLLGPTVHPYAWLLWLAAATALVGLTLNPLVLIPLLLAVAIVRAASAPPGLDGHGGIPLMRLAALVVPFAAIYNLLAAHSGAHVLWRLPGAWPLIGGPLTLEALVYGALSGTALMTLVATFSTFQRALGTRDLLRFVPRALGAVSLAIAVALTYVPATFRQFGLVREAQAVRGLEQRGPRAWLSLALPLLVGALERSVQVAEVMTARGLLNVDGLPVGRGARGLVLGGLAAAVAGWMGWATGRVSAPAGGGVAASGLAMVGGALWLQSRRLRPHVSFRALAWHASDVAVVAAAWLPLGVWWFLPGARHALAYNPYPQLAWPMAEPQVTLALLGLTAPAWVLLLAAGRGSVTPDAPQAETPDPRDETTTGPWALAVSFEHFTFTYPSDPATASNDPMPGDSLRDRAAVRDVELDLPAGVLTLIAGPSGVGKSTLLRAVNGLVPHFTGGTVWGTVVLSSGGSATVHEGVHAGPIRLDPIHLDPIHFGPGPMSAYVGFVPGDPESSFVLDRVADEVALALEERGLSRQAMAARVRAALDQAGIGALADRPLATLSGGERQRVSLAAALAMDPAVLVLDEPTSQLDDDAADGLLDMLAKLAADGRRTILVSEHRIDRVVPYARHMVYLPAPGASAISGRPEAVLPQVVQPVVPRPPLTTPGEVRLAWDDVWFSYGNAERKAASGLSSRWSSGQASGPFSEPPSMSTEEGPPSAGSSVLRGAALDLRAGEVVALTGPSGSGKTTLLKLAVGLLRPARGEIRLAGATIAGRSVAEVCRQVGYLPQDPNALLYAETVREELLATLANHGLAAGGPYDADTLLETLGIATFAQTYPRDLSTGQRQRVALGAVMVTRPGVLLLDEPTRGLDNSAIAALAQLLHRQAQAGTAVLVATHDQRLVQAAHRVVRLAGGQIA